MDAVDEILAQWREARPDLDVAPMGVIGRLSRVSHHLRREMERNFARHGLNGPSFDVLATLRRSPPPHALTPGELSSAMMITSGTTTNRIDQLEKSDHVTRRVDAGDGRRSIVRLTAKGRRIIDAAVSEHVAVQARLLAPLSAKEARELDRLLGRYLEGIEG